MVMQKKISLGQFSKLIKVATYEQLASIPKHCFPDDVPKSIIDDVPYKLRPQLEALLFEINAYQIGLSTQIEADYGREVQSAYTLSKFDKKNTAHRQFKDKVIQLVQAFNNEKGQGGAQSHEFNQLHAAVKSMTEEIYAELKNVDKASNVIHGAVLQAEKSGKKDHQFALKGAIEILSKRFFDLDKYVSLYLYVNIHNIIKEMNRVMTQVQKISENAEAILEEIELKREDLARLKTSMIGRISQKSKMGMLQHDITMLQGKLVLNETVISESHLLHWLDTLVESSMSEYVRVRAKAAIQAARLKLFKLLHKYCELQENTAKQVAHNPFTQINPESSIQYAIKSEEFVLNYFIKKKNNVTVFLQGSAQKRIDGLTNLEEELIAEMRRNLRSFR